MLEKEAKNTIFKTKLYCMKALSIRISDLHKESLHLVETPFAKNNCPIYLVTVSFLYGQWRKETSRGDLVHYSHKVLTDCSTCFQAFSFYQLHTWTYWNRIFLSIWFWKGETVQRFLRVKMLKSSVWPIESTVASAPD